MTRILLVEDEAHVAERLVALFESHGLETIACATAEDALDAPACDVVLAHLKLPGTSGVDLSLKPRVQALERALFREALRRTGGRKAEAARLLGFDPSNWSYHAKRLGLQ